MTRNPLDIRGNDQEQEAADLEQRLAREREVNDLKSVMATPNGRRFVWRLLEKTGLYKSSMTGNSQTFFLEGQRNIGLYLLAQINDHCLEEYVLMLGENRTP